jgi:hypothetical protein
VTTSERSRRADGEGLGRLRLLVVGVLLVTTPAVTLVVAYGVLLATRSALLAELTLVEAIELYLIELGAFVLFAFLLYRLTLAGARRVDADADADETPGTGADAAVGSGTDGPRTRERTGPGPGPGPGSGGSDDPAGR